MPRRDRFRCRLSSRLSSRVSSGPLYVVFTGATPQRGSPAAVPQPRRLPWAYCADMTTWSVAGGSSPQSVLVDVDALDDLAVLGAVHDLVLRVLGLVQRQSQLFHSFHLLVVRGTYLPNRVVYIEHSTNPEGGVQRPNTTGWRPSRAPLGVHVLLPKTATASLVPASRGSDAGPLPPVALVVPGHRTPSGCLAFGVTGRHPGRLPPSRRHQFGEGEARSRQVLGHPHPPRVSGDVPPAREPGRLRCLLQTPPDGVGWRLKTGVTASITASSGRTASRASTAAGPRCNTPPRPPGRSSTPESGCGRCRLRPAPRPPSAGRRPRRPAAARRA